MTIVVLGGGLAFVWTGITDPGGGVAGLMSSVLAGNLPKPKAGGTAAAQAASAVSAQNSASAGAAAEALGQGVGQVGGLIAQMQNGPGVQQSAVVRAAAGELGTPYVWGGGGANGPSNGGFDCSGLTQFAYHQAYGITIPRVAEGQRLAAQSISASQAAPGDLVFFGAPAYHVGIVAGGGQMIHAPHTGTVVKYEAISDVQPGPVNYGSFGQASGAAT